MSGTNEVGESELLDDSREYTAEELCRLCRLEPGRFEEYVAHGVVTASGAAGKRFTHVELHRLVRAVKVRREFELELPSLALVVDLLERLERQGRELERLRRQVGAPSGRSRVP